MVIEFIANLKKLVTLSNISEIKKFFSDIVLCLESDNCDDAFEKKIISQMKREVNKYRRNFKNKYPGINNLYFYPENQPFLYFCSLIVRFKEVSKDEFNLLGCINICIEMIDKFDLTRTEHVSFEEEMEMLFLVLEKYNLYSLLNSNDKEIHFYNLPCVLNQDGFDIMLWEYSKGIVTDIVLFDQKVVDRDARHLYITLLGRIFNYLLIGNFNEGPYGMTRFLKKIDICYDDLSKEEAPIIFAKFFAISCLYDNKYKDILSNEEMELAPLIDEYVKEAIEKFRNDWPVRPYREVNDEAMCPCGSGKSYINCCKKKRFKWVTDDEKIGRRIPVDTNFMEEIKDFKKHTEEVLGRKLLDHEKMFRFISGPELSVNELILHFRKVGMPENFLYAYYKTGLLLCEFNIDKVPEYELDSWNEALYEYENLIKNNDKVEFIRNVNEQLRNTWEKYLINSFDILNAFINDVKEDFFDNLVFEINDINDFIVFCVRRVIKTGKALMQNLENDHYEMSMSIIRMLYEDLLNINVYINNREMFDKHIMPLVLIEKGIYERFTDDKGNVSNKTAVNPKTNEKINYSITLKDLSKKSRKEYSLLYDELFRDLSAYTHLNITVKDIYFSNPDPFFEIERTNVAGIIGLFFINQIIYELATISKINDLMYRDLLFFSDQVKEELNVLFNYMKDINCNEKNLYSILFRCVNDYDKLK